MDVEFREPKNTTIPAAMDILIANICTQILNTKS
jgi:hypothetical protein